MFKEGAVYIFSDKTDLNVIRKFAIDILGMDPALAQKIYPGKTMSEYFTDTTYRSGKYAEVRVVPAELFPTFGRQVLEV